MAEGVVRDLSEQGAMLLVDEPARLPPDLHLETVRGGPRRVRVVWRGAGAVGVAFAAADEPARPGDTVVSLAAAREARLAPSDAERLAARMAAVLRRPDRPRPHWL